MVSGVQQGRLLHSLVRIARPARVLELGCFTGYAAMWMAEALPPGGQLLSLERDERCAAVATRHLREAGLADRVEVRVGDAMDTLSSLPRGGAPFDLVFLDADKQRCTEYCGLLLDRGLVAPHALLLVDNVLWKGRVLERLDPHALLAESESARALDRKV